MASKMRAILSPFVNLPPAKTESLPEESTSKLEEAQLPTGTSNPRALAKLREVAADLLKDGAYAQFMDVVESLADAISEEPARYKAALKVVSKQGVAIADILDAFRAQRERLEQEKVSNAETAKAALVKLTANQQNEL